VRFAGIGAYIQHGETQLRMASFLAKHIPCNCVKGLMRQLKKEDPEMSFCLRCREIVESHISSLIVRSASPFVTVLVDVRRMIGIVNTRGRSASFSEVFLIDKDLKMGNRCAMNSY
jgi:hypothetical protein